MRILLKYYAFQNFFFKNLNSLVIIFFIFSTSSFLNAFEFATYVIDARSGDFLYGKNYNKKLHPASLTKMMTLYLAFNELKNNRIKLDQTVSISSNASKEPPSKLGLKKGQRVSVRNLIRGAAIRSANDAATALGELISGSENKFADYMTLTAQQMGMKDTTFKNAHGLTSAKHISTPKDMAILARRLIYDFPEYYNLFGRNSVNVLGRTLYNTNRKFLSQYNGSDGIKTGFTSSAGFNLAASAKRGNKRIIGVVFGSSSVSLRNKRMTELLNIGFANSKENVAFTSLKKLSLYPNIINISGENSLLKVSKEPVKRPLILEKIPLVENNKNSDEIEKLIIGLNNDLKMEFKLVEYSKIPLVRPASFMIKGKKITNLKNNQNIEENQSPLSIMVGFYYNKYNAELDLPGILLNDSSLTDEINAEVVSVVYMKKQGFRINISPLTKQNAIRACEKIKALGQLCEISK